MRSASRFGMVSKPSSSQQGCESVVVCKLSKRFHDEYETIAGRLSFLDHQALALGILLKGFYQFLRKSTDSAPALWQFCGFPRAFAYLDQSASRNEAASPQKLSLIRLVQCRLNTLVVRLTNLKGNGYWQISRFNGSHEFSFTLLQEFRDRPYIIGRETCFLGNLAIRMTALPHSDYILKEIDRLMLTPGAVLNQARHKTVFGIGGDNQRGHLSLAELAERFQPALPDKPDRTDGPSAPCRDVTVIGRLSPMSEMLSTIPLKTFLLRRRGFTMVIRSMGIISTRCAGKAITTPPAGTGRASLKRTSRRVN